MLILEWLINEKIQIGNYTYPLNQPRRVKAHEFVCVCVWERERERERERDGEEYKDLDNLPLCNKVIS